MGVVLAQGHRDAQQGAKHQGTHTQKRMQKKQHGDIHKHPGHVKKCEQALPCDELAQLGQVRKCTRRIFLVRVEVLAVTGLKHLRADRAVKAHPHADEQARTQPLGQGTHAKQVHRDDGDKHQGELAATDQHAVIHLQHVDRGGEHEQVGHDAEHRSRHKLVLQGQDASGHVGGTLAHVIIPRASPTTPRPEARKLAACPHASRAPSHTPRAPMIGG